jgi:hypothetical protein
MNNLAEVETTRDPEPRFQPGHGWIVTNNLAEVKTSVPKIEGLEPRF